MKVCQWLVERHTLAWTPTPDSHRRTDVGWLRAWRQHRVIRSFTARRAVNWPMWYVNFWMSHRLPQRRRGRRRCADSCSAATAFLWLWDTAVFDPTSRKPLNRFYCNLKLRRTPEDYTSNRIWFRSDDVGGLGEYPVCHCRVSFFAILVASSRAQVVPVTNCDELL